MPRTVHTERGMGQSSMTWTFCLSMVTPATEITWPRYATDRSLKLHLDRLMNSWCSCNAVRTRRTCRRCFDQVEL
jgi:hypothetical protein